MWYGTQQCSKCWWTGYSTRWLKCRWIKYWWIKCELQWCECWWIECKLEWFESWWIECRLQWTECSCTEYNEPQWIECCSNGFNEPGWLECCSNGNQWWPQYRLWRSQWLEAMARSSVAWLASVNATRVAYSCLQSILALMPMRGTRPGSSADFSNLF